MMDKQQNQQPARQLCTLLPEQYVHLYEVLQQTMGETGETVLQLALMSLAYDEGVPERLWHEQPCGCAECDS